MDTVVGSHPGRRTRASQEETSPFPLEWMIARSLERMSQEETAPFPLDFEVVASKRRARQEETSPFLLEHRVAEPDADVARPGASVESLREQAEPLRSLESTHRLESSAFESTHPLESTRRRSRPIQFLAVAKFTLCVVLLGGVLVAATVGGDDAALRSAGDAIGRWFTGRSAAFERAPLLAPAASPCNQALGGARSPTSAESSR